MCYALVLEACILFPSILHMFLQKGVFSIKSEKGPQKATYTKYQICRYSKPKSIQFERIQKQENYKFFKCFHSMVHAYYRSIYQQDNTIMYTFQREYL